MSEPRFEENLVDTDDVADYIVSEFAAENNGVAKVLPSAEIQAHLDDEWETMVTEVKDAVLNRDVIIA